MKRIYSRIEKGTLLHIINRLHWDDTRSMEREDIAPAEQFLQLSLLHLGEGRSFAPHKHIWKTPSYDRTIAQESWIVVQGKVKISLYDLDDALVETTILNAGDCSVTFEGGHAYEILEEDTVVYEYKTGPYLGQKLDKEFIK